MEDTNEKNRLAFRKRRVKRIKRIIVAIVVFLLVFPMILSVFLLIRVSDLETKIEKISSKTGIVLEDVPKDMEIAKAAVQTASPVAVVTDSAIQQGQKVYLTFEDGPSQQTERILDILKKNDVKATFFVVAHEDSYSKKLYKRIVDEGHTIGIHSYSHISREIYRSFESFKSDFDKVYELVKSCTGQSPKFFRFVGGSSKVTGNITIEECKSYLQEKGVTYLDWNVVSGDVIDGKYTIRQMKEKVMNNVGRYDASIVQLHDSSENQNTVKLLSGLIHSLKKEGCDLLPVDEKTNIVQHKQ